VSVPPPEGLAPAPGWLDTPSERLSVPTLSQAGWLFRALAKTSRWFGRSQVPGIFLVLNTQRRLFLPWLWFASRLMPYGTLPDTVRELLILRTGWNCRCRYEWGQHVEIGLRTGLCDLDIVQVSQGPQAFEDACQRTTLQACDELCLYNVVQAPTWQALSEHWAPPELVEILVLVGHYRMLAGLLNSAALPLEAPVEACLAAFHERLHTRP
jgi:alkylhydroperoxidase family enzyme